MKKIKILQLLCLIITDLGGGGVVGREPSISLSPTSSKFGHSFFSQSQDITYSKTRCFGKITLGEKNNTRASIYS